MNHDDDNNGLWTSLVVGAEAFRYAATGDPQAYDLTMTYYHGETHVPGMSAANVGTRLLPCGSFRTTVYQIPFLSFISTTTSILPPKLV